MCFSAPFDYVHTDRHTDTNDTIYTFLTCSYYPPYPKCCADLTSICTIFGVEICIPSCIGSSPFFLHDLHTGSLHLSIWGRTILYKIMFQTML